MLRRVIRPVAILGALAFVPLVAGSASAAIVNCSVTPADQAIDAEEAQMLTLVNQHRMANGRSPLSFRFGATRAAAWMSRDMANRDFLPLDHVDSLGRGFTTRLSQCGVRATVGYENIAWREPNPTAQDIFNDWVNSPTHNTNMLRTDVTHIGIARAANPGSTRWYWTQVFITPSEATRYDFNDNGATDIAVWRDSAGVWYFRDGSPTQVFWGASGDLPVPADYDGNRSTDIAVFRPASGAWFIRNSNGSLTQLFWGASGDVPVPGDYDGNGTADVAVFRPASGAWYIRNSNGSLTQVFWGAEGDIPVPRDYDGNGTTDVAVFRPGTGAWYIRNSNGSLTQVFWGAEGDIPVPEDYDGNNVDDIAVFRPGTGAWFIRNSNGSLTQVFWGAQGDVPVPGDYDDDGSTDIAVFRNGAWYLRNVVGLDPVIYWGASGDQPTPLPTAVYDRFF
jgi:uncharacterized protein YkwD